MLHQRFYQGCKQDNAAGFLLSISKSTVLVNVTTNISEREQDLAASLAKSTSA